VAAGDLAWAAITEGGRLRRRRRMTVAQRPGLTRLRVLLGDDFLD
jgi:hypothetical protein